MKRVIVTANPESMQAYRLASRFAEDHFEFRVSEIDLPPEPAAARSSRNGEKRLGEMARHINTLVTIEDPESWILAGPLGVLVHLLPQLNPSVKTLLCDATIGDLTGLTANRIARHFSPAEAAA